MTLSDIADMENYLKNRCYCKGEIYDVSGFSYQIFDPEEECTVIANGKSKDGTSNIVTVICRDQIINFWIHDGMIESAERYDATKNNIKQIVNVITGKSNTCSLDEFKEGETEKNLEDILKFADAIMIS